MSRYAVLSRRALLALSTVLLASLPLHAQAQAKDVKIGVLLPLTGRYAEAGTGSLRGLQLIVNETNAAGGIKALGGAKIELALADDAADTEKTVTGARRLINDEKVSFIIGPYSTPEAEAFMPVADRFQVGGVGLQTTIIPRTPYYSMISIPAANFGKGYADLIGWLRGKGAKIDSVVITYPNNDYGQLVSKSAASILTAGGIKVTDSIAADPHVKDMTPIVLKVKSLAPDAVISVVYFQDGVLLHKARFNLGYTSPIWLGGSAGFTDDKLWNVLGDEVAEKTLTRSFGLAFFSPDAALPGLQSLLERAHKAYPGKVIDQSFVMGAQAGIFLVHALENAKSTDPKAVNAAFRALKFPAKSPAIVAPFITGDFIFSADGVTQGSSPLFVQWKAGKKAIVYPESVATAAPVLPAR